MAEFAAHLNQGTSGNRPSIFEVIAQESMTSVLRPAIVYALKTLASSNPARWGWTWRFADEAYVLIDYLMQNHYFKRYSATFSEHFYGLKRTPLFTTPSLVGDNLQLGGPTASVRSLSARHRCLSLLVSIFLPYVKLKCDELFEKLREESLSGHALAYLPRRRSCFSQLKRIFVWVYPFLHFTWETAFLCFQLLYMFGLCETHSPLLRVMGLKLQRLTRQDILAHQLKSTPLLQQAAKTWREKLVALPGSLSNFLISGFANGLPVVVFFLKFVEWWYSSEHSGTVAAVTQLPIPPPPQQPKVAQHGTPLPAHPTQCPVCKKVRTNPTVLGSSGYVFCYPCIHRYLSQHGCCPVTHLPSTSHQLVRLYTENMPGGQ